jgi:UDP-glucuronate decarboxylase
MYNPIKTIKTNTIGTINMLGLARRVKARLLFASTSEVYGDPEIHPQPEAYWGNVNPIGPRACYDEAKRVAEAMCYAYAKQVTAIKIKLLSCSTRAQVRSIRKTEPLKKTNKQF